MKFGLFGSAQARRGGPDVDSGEGYRDFLEYNVEAEALGFRSTFLVEHHFTGLGQVSASLTMLAWLGARTTTLRLGTAVTVLPWHNPVLLAEQAATIDLLSGGRLDFGIGKGYRHNEFAGFGIRMEDADDRFNECVEVLLKAWTSETRFSHQGKNWNFHNIVVEPPAAQRPHPPIWMGASSDSSIRSVAERGYNLLLDQFTSLEELKHRISLFRTEVEARGRVFDPMSVGIARAFYVADGKEDRDRSLQNRLDARWRQLEIAKAPSGDNNNWRFQSYDDTRANNEETAIYGSPDEIAEKLEGLKAIGAGYLLLNGGGSGGGERGRMSLRRFAREILPHFDKAQSNAGKVLDPA